ncbi:MAG: nucleotidyl transferase AbiEii/AbiGii toxin family protein [Pyrinomonadaceae bacterium]
MERFLYLLSKSNHVDQFILKGALMMRVWDPHSVRPTLGIDMLGRTSNDIASIVQQIKSVLSVRVDPDGIECEPASIRSERILEDAEYEGIRIRFRGRLGTAVLPMLLDIGFGDIVFPNAIEEELPTILESPAPRLLCYSRESVIAEKFEAMVNLGTLNSRIKDFHDIWLLSRQFDFDGMKLAEAIRLTFGKRNTVLPGRIEAFEHQFVSEKQVQWAAFRKRLGKLDLPESFGEIVLSIDEFVSPLVRLLKQKETLFPSWRAKGPWQ